MYIPNITKDYNVNPSDAQDAFNKAHTATCGALNPVEPAILDENGYKFSAANDENDIQQTLLNANKSLRADGAGTTELAEFDLSSESDSIARHLAHVYNHEFEGRYRALLQSAEDRDLYD
jgi:hypothetical protein